MSANSQFVSNDTITCPDNNFFPATGTETPQNLSLISDFTQIRLLSNLVPVNFSESKKELANRE